MKESFIVFASATLVGALLSSPVLAQSKQRFTTELDAQQYCKSDPLYGSIEIPNPTTRRKAQCMDGPNVARICAKRCSQNRISRRQTRKGHGVLSARERDRFSRDPSNARTHAIEHGHVARESGTQSWPRTGFSTV
jgi:hypothetical protein